MGNRFSEIVFTPVVPAQQELHGSDPTALGVAYQDTEGFWHAEKNVSVDATARTVTTTTSTPA